MARALYSNGKAGACPLYEKVPFGSSELFSFSFITGSVEDEGMGAAYEDEWNWPAGGEDQGDEFYEEVEDDSFSPVPWRQVAQVIEFPDVFIDRLENRGKQKAG